MPNTPEQERVMEESAKQFLTDLQGMLLEFDPAERKAVGQFVDLIKKHFMVAGYKRIFKQISKVRHVME